MKNNKLALTGVAIVVLGVWGTIFYKVYLKMMEGDETTQAPVETISAVNLGVEKDTFRLIANYEDPFLSHTIRERSNGNFSGAAAHPAPHTPKPAFHPAVTMPLPSRPEVHYNGMIRNASKNKKIAMLVVNGKSLMLAEQQSADNIKVISVFRDSVQVEYSKQRWFVRL